MGIRNFPVITVGTDTSTHQSVSGAGAVSIPNLQSGENPKFLRIKAYGGDAVEDFVSVTPDIAANSGVFATGMVLSLFYGDVVILNVHGYSHIGFDIQGTGGGTIDLAPLEDF